MKTYYQLRFLFTAFLVAGVICFAIMFLVLGCAHERKRECTWICADDSIPHSCYCVEDIDEGETNDNTNN